MSQLHAVYIEKAGTKEAGKAILRKHKKVLKQSEYFSQFYRSLLLEFLDWDWSEPFTNIPRKVSNAVYESLRPKSCISVKLPQLGDLILNPDSDWFITEDFVEFGNILKGTYEELTQILNDLGMFVPNIYSLNTGKTYIHYRKGPDNSSGDQPGTGQERLASNR